MVQSISLRLPNNPYVAQHVWMISNFPNSGISKSLNFQAYHPATNITSVCCPTLFLSLCPNPPPSPQKQCWGDMCFVGPSTCFVFDPLPLQHCFRGRGGSTLFWGDGAGGVGGGRRIHKTEVMFVAGLTARNCPSKEEVRFRTRAPVLQLLSMNA